MKSSKALPSKSWCHKFSRPPPFIFFLSHHTTHISKYLRKERENIFCHIWARNLNRIYLVNVSGIFLTKRILGTKIALEGKKETEGTINLSLMTFISLKSKLFIHTHFSIRSRKKYHRWAGQIEPPLLFVLYEESWTYWLQRQMF